MSMTIKELNCDFNMPEKLESSIINGEEVAHGLPPYAPVKAYSVDKYPGCPNNWMNGSDIASSYFLGVKEDKGMWLNFNQCLKHNYHVAAVISIQGVNPITGKKTDKLRLEKYKEKCPIHDKVFQSERFCPDCKFKWPAQNYLATTGTPYGLFWLDGFRTPEGKVRQYIFTAEKIKGIANQLIGKDRVFAIGIAFYLSKEKRKEIEHVEAITKDPYAGGLCSPPDVVQISSNNNNLLMGDNKMFYSPFNWNADTLVNNVDNSVATGYVGQSMSGKTKRAKSSVLRSVNNGDERVTTKVVAEYEKTSAPIKITKKLEVGAGALIKQQVYEDPEEMSFWRDEPYGMIYINYCDEESLKKILAKGQRKEEKEGFMKDLKVGG